MNEEPVVRMVEVLRPARQGERVVATVEGVGPMTSLGTFPERSYEALLAIDYCITMTGTGWWRNL